MSLYLRNCRRIVRRETSLVKILSDYTESGVRLIVLEELGIKKLVPSKPDKLVNTRQVNSISLKRNKLSELDGRIFEDMDLLQHVNVSENRLERVFNFFQMNQIKVLDLSHNLLFSLKGLSDCENLSVLDISHNKFNGVDQLREVFLLGNLEVFDFRNNSFSNEKDVVEIVVKRCARKLFAVNGHVVGAKVRSHTTFKNVTEFDFKNGYRKTEKLRQNVERMRSGIQLREENTYDESDEGKLLKKKLFFISLNLKRLEVEQRKEIDKAMVLLNRRKLSDEPWMHEQIYSTGISGGSGMESMEQKKKFSYDPRLRFEMKNDAGAASGGLLDDLYDSTTTDYNPFEKKVEVRLREGPVAEVGEEEEVVEKERRCAKCAKLKPGKLCGRCQMQQRKAALEAQRALEDRQLEVALQEQVEAEEEEAKDDILIREEELQRREEEIQRRMEQQKLRREMLERKRREIEELRKMQEFEANAMDDEQEGENEGGNLHVEDEIIEEDEDELGVQGLLNKAIKLIRQKQAYEEALDVLAGADVYTTENIDVYLHRSLCYYCLERYKKALKLINKSLRLISFSSDHSLKDKAGVMKQRGLIFKEMGKYDQARTDFSNAIKMDPDVEIELSKEIEEVKVLQMTKAVEEGRKLGGVDDGSGESRQKKKKKWNPECKKCAKRKKMCGKCKLKAKKEVVSAGKKKSKLQLLKEKAKNRMLARLKRQKVGETV